MVDLKLQLPDGFLNEEVRCGYTVTKQRKEVWAVELDLLQEFMRVCNKYGLKYCADGGTLLGAIRHHGFIPWDDDLDIAMLRSDFEKLNEVAPAEFKKPYPKPCGRSYKISSRRFSNKIIASYRTKCADFQHHSPKSCPGKFQQKRQQRSASGQSKRPRRQLRVPDAPKIKHNRMKQFYMVDMGQKM